MVEQSAAVALEIADYGYVMENGRIVLDGTAERLRATPTSRSSISASPERRAPRATATSSSIAAAGDGMAELAVERLTLRFGGLTVLDGVSLAVEPANCWR